MCHLFHIWGGCNQKQDQPGVFLFILNAGMAEKDLSEIIKIDSQVGRGGWWGKVVLPRTFTKKEAVRETEEFECGYFLSSSV